MRGLNRVGGGEGGGALNEIFYNVPNQTINNEEHFLRASVGY